MNKILLIIKREYITRVRKRAFIIMTILGPIIFAGLLIVPTYLATMEDAGVKTVAVVELRNDVPVSEEDMIFKDMFESNEKLQFEYLPGINLPVVEMLAEGSDYFGILVLNHEILQQSKAEITFYSKKQPSLITESFISKEMEDYLFQKNLEQMNLSPEKIKSFKPEIRLKTNRLEKGKFEEQKGSDAKRIIGYAAGFLIYFLIFFFGAQVMRGVIEEKTSRIVEVIVTSVKPFQLMMGKIIGIALVGLTQFAVWVVLTATISQVALSQFNVRPQMGQNQFQQVSPAAIQQENPETPKLIKELETIKWSDVVYVMLTFIFYFIFGYLLYAAMFAAIGSIVDAETDTQQFMLPVTIPLILSIVVMANAITNPEGKLVYWFSIIPFTSPIIMMARIPFRPEPFDLILSMLLLLATFIAMTWLAGKIYRTGILMYGKKITYRELIKWLSYKN